MQSWSPASRRDESSYLIELARITSEPQRKQKFVARAFALAQEEHNSREEATKRSAGSIPS
jgi:hypothetical protein